MIPKIIEFPNGVGLDGMPCVEPILFGNRGIVKTAAAYHPAVQAFISQFVRPHPDHLFVLKNAVSDGYVYGSNINGDFFSEDSLAHRGMDYGHQTFTRAGIFQHHQNKDPKKSLGKIVFTFYNPRMHRVELIEDILRPKALEEGAADLLARIDAGQRPPVSMGCRVPFDICSWCGHYSRTRSDYCQHALQYMNHVATPELIAMLGLNIEPGTKMYVINTRPDFFDMSYVLIGADQTSYAIKKVASRLYMPARLSADVALSQGLTSEKVAALAKRAVKSKDADILKQVPAMTAERMSGVQGAEPQIQPGLLEGMANQLGPGDALSTCTGMGIVLSPSEFQHLLLAAMGRHRMARQFDGGRHVFRPTSDVDRSLGYGAGDFSTALRNALMPMFTSRSIFAPVLQRRVTIIAGTPEHLRHRAPQRQQVGHPVLDKVSAAYSGYLDTLPEKMASMTPLAASDLEMVEAMFAFSGRRQFYNHMAKYSAPMDKALLLGLFPLLYLYARSLKQRKQHGEPMNMFQEFVRKHPMISASALAGASHLASRG